MKDFNNYLGVEGRKVKEGGGKKREIQNDL